MDSLPPVDRSRIDVTKRSRDYMACIRGYPNIWEAGTTAEDVIERLVQGWNARLRPQAVQDPPSATPVT